MYVMATPARMSVAGIDPIRFERRMIKSIGMTANRKAFIIPPISEKIPPPTEMPKIMATAIPKHAPDEIPVVYGSAKGFFIMLCMAAPAPPSPIPAMTVQKVLA